ncbi:hypothetical protein MHBO_000076, partial [Bonamia ostreae]
NSVESTSFGSHLYERLASLSIEENSLYPKNPLPPIGTKPPQNPHENDTSLSDFDLSELEGSLFTEESSQNENESKDSHSVHPQYIMSSAETKSLNFGLRSSRGQVPTNPINHEKQLNQWLSLCRGPRKTELLTLKNYFVFDGKLFFMDTSDSIDIPESKNIPEVRKIIVNLTHLNIKNEVAKDFNKTAEFLINQLMTQELLSKDCHFYKTDFCNNYSIVIVPSTKWNSIKSLLYNVIYCGFYGNFVGCFFFCGHFVLAFQYNGIKQNKISLNSFTLRQIVAFLCFLENKGFRLVKEFQSNGMFLDDRENITFNRLDIDTLYKGPAYNAAIITRFLTGNQTIKYDQSALQGVIDDINYCVRGKNRFLASNIKLLMENLLRSPLYFSEPQLPNVFLVQVRGNNFCFVFTF